MEQHDGSLVRIGSAVVELWLFVIALSTVLVGCGCGGPDEPAAAAGCSPGEVSCDHGGCQPAGLPCNMPCPPGELPLDGGTCQKAGVPPSACAAGFMPDGNDGCEPILPVDPCFAGEMAVPGETACRPIAL